MKLLYFLVVCIVFLGSFALGINVRAKDPKKTIQTTRKERKLLYFLVVCIVFLGSFALGINVRAKELGVKMYDIGGTHQLPVLAKSEAFPVLSGQGVIAVDADSNVTLYEKDADSQLYPASTTKIITALVSLDHYKQDDTLTVKRVGVEGQKMGLLLNEQISFDSLMNGLLIYSANDAAVTLADNYPGGYDAFVNAMNDKAVVTCDVSSSPIGLAK